jgi:hypothetical protein
MLDAGVVAERKDGRERYYALRRDSLTEIDAFLARLDDFRAERLRRLGDHLDVEP